VGFQAGQRVADYEILGLLGIGGMGCVYRVRNVISHRTEAMKVLLGDLQAEAELATRFVSEIRTLATLDHPNIAQLHTALQVGNELLMVMEFVDGLTLQQMATQNAFPLDEVVRYTYQVLAALGFAHKRGVVHRDIKPANIMLSSEGIVKLTDFGIAKSRLRDDLTRPGTTLGSLSYMAPEQAISGKIIDGRTDLYSLGITMYELLAGRKPFDDESAYVVLHSQLHTAPSPPIEINPLLPRAVNDVILRALEKDPANRFQSAAEFSDALQQATGITPSAAIERAGFAAAGKPNEQSMAVTSRFPTGVRRRMWVGAGSIAILGIPVVTALALPHLTSRPMVNAVSMPIKQWAPPSAPSPEETAPPETVNEGESLPTSDPAPLPVEKQAPPQPHISEAKKRAIAAPAKVTPAPEETAVVRDMPPPRPATSATTLAAAEDLRSQKVSLDARAAVVRLSVQHMKSEREANGSALPEDVAGAYVRMNAYLNAEKSDLEDGDVAAALDHMNKAATEVAALEKLFNK
jgi:eukaryotic-like serine/threonine-protein kinase